MSTVKEGTATKRSPQVRQHMPRRKPRVPRQGPSQGYEKKLAKNNLNVGAVGAERLGEQVGSVHGFIKACTSGLLQNATNAPVISRLICVV